jgi:hypothetical protein
MYHHQTKKKKKKKKNTSFPTLNNLITNYPKKPTPPPKNTYPKNKTFSKADVIPQTLQM